VLLLFVCLTSHFLRTPRYR